MCFFKKNQPFSLSSLLGFDSTKIDFESIFPFNSYATTSLAVATSQSPASKLILLNDCQGTIDPPFAVLLEVKMAELQRAIHEQTDAVKVDEAWTMDAPSGDDFIYLHANTVMSDVLDLVFQSNVRQRRSVLVNIERSSLIQDKPSRLTALIARDAFFHVNFLSLLGHHGDAAKRVALRLLHAGRVAYLGFGMDDFSILAEKKQIELEKSVIALIADQTQQRKNTLTLRDEVPLIG